MTKTIKTGLLLWGLFLPSVMLWAQEKQGLEKETFEQPYSPEANAQQDIDSLLLKAQKENKKLIIQAGGNWCIWCLRFNHYIQNTAAVKKLLDDNFLYYHLNYSKENKNEEVFHKFAPEGGKLGYPFFIALDNKGKVISVHDSGSLESGKGYDEKKVLDLFNSWL